MPFSLPDRLTNLLDAVNTCLSAIGVEPVNTVFDNQDIDVQNALNVLREQDLSVQSKGWEFNTERDFKILPDTDGFIQLPKNTLSIDSAYWTSSPNAPCRVVERGTRLYNQDEHSYVFTEGLFVDFIQKLSFEELPEVARRYIAILAAQQMQMRFQGSGSSDRVIQDDVNRALIALEQWEDRVADRNMNRDNKSIVSALFGRGLRRRT